MRAPAESDIRAPEFPGDLEWVNSPPLRMAELAGGSAALLEFIDTARVNSHRTLPYLSEWHARYSPLGLAVIGVHCPGYSFGADPGPAREAIAKLGIGFPVVLDPGFGLWRDYGNRGWPGRYLFDADGRLRYIHYGEGDYRDCELAIGECLAELGPGIQLPEPMAPLRPEDAEGVLLEPQTADVALPADRDRVELVRDWTDGADWIEARDAGAAATVKFSAGSAWAVLSGTVAPGLYATDGTVVADDPGLRLHGFQFTPKPPG